jgi:hypothetical protein
MFKGNLTLRKIYTQTKPPLGARINFANSMTKGMVGLWLFNEGQGTKIQDSTRNGYSGTLTNMAMPSTSVSGWNPGKFGKCLMFDGGNDYSLHGSVLDLGLKDLTIIAWIKTSTVARASIAGRKGASAGNVGYCLEVAETSGIVRMRLDGASGNKTANGNLVTDGKYHCVAGVAKRDENMTVYVDGVTGTPVSISALKSDNITNALNFYIGCRTTSSGLFTGAIEFVCVYFRAFSGGEILRSYKAPFAMFNR